MCVCVQGLKAANKHETVLPFVEGMVEFLHRSAADENRTSEVLKACVGLLGDLGQTFGNKMQALYQMPFVPMLLQQASQEDDDIQEVAQWAQSVCTIHIMHTPDHCFLLYCNMQCILNNNFVLYWLLMHFSCYSFHSADGRDGSAQQINTYSSVYEPPLSVSPLSYLQPLLGLSRQQWYHLN